MVAYTDTSALLKRYVAEPESATANVLLRGASVLVTSWVTVVEVRRNLARLVSGPALRRVIRQFEEDLDALAMVAADEVVCRAAARIGEELGVRSLDAIHLASAQRLLVSGLSFITFDLRQAQAARSLGFAVLGA